MSDGLCAFCSADYVVSVDGVPACLAHLPVAMQPMRDRVGEIVREALTAGAPRDAASS